MSLDLEDMSFEEALNELETTVSRLEAGDLTLEEALLLFERGQQMAAFCNAQLDGAVLRVEQLTAEGEIVPLSID